MGQGMRKGLTSSGDPEFSLSLRKAFIKAMGASDDALSRPVTRRREKAGEMPNTGPVSAPKRGGAALLNRRVLQAHQGCDFDFLVSRGSAS